MPTYPRRLEVSLLQSGLTAGAALGFTVVAAGGAPLAARTAVGVTEDGSSACYFADVAAWDTSWGGTVVWDAGAGTLDREPFLPYTPQTGDVGPLGAGLTAVPPVALSAPALAAIGARTPAVRAQDAVTAPTLDDCLVAAWADAVGRGTQSSGSYVITKPDRSGPLRTLTLVRDGNGNADSWS